MSNESTKLREWFASASEQDIQALLERTNYEFYKNVFEPSVLPDQERGETIEFSNLRDANAARQLAWCPKNKPDLSFRGNELAGETGEACNVIKKLERERLGWTGSLDTLEHLGEELADVVIVADLIAQAVGIDLESAVRNKFNATSEERGFPHRITEKCQASVLQAARKEHPSGFQEVWKEVVEEERVWGKKSRGGLQSTETGKTLSPQNAEWNGVCKCGHRHSEHRESLSINYTASSCKVKGCPCCNFVGQ